MRQPLQSLLIVLIAIEYQGVVGTLMERLRARRRNRQAEKAVEGIDFSSIPGIVGVTLDRLQGVKESHIRTWFRVYVNEFCRDNPRRVPNATILEEKLMPQVRMLFQSREHIDDGRISMEMIATTLRDMLNSIIEESLVEGGRL